METAQMRVRLWQKMGMFAFGLFIGTVLGLFWLIIALALLVGLIYDAYILPEQPQKAEIGDYFAIYFREFLRVSIFSYTWERWGFGTGVVVWLIAIAAMFLGYT